MNAIFALLFHGLGDFRLVFYAPTDYNYADNDDDGDSRPDCVDPRKIRTLSLYVQDKMC